MTSEPKVVMSSPTPFVADLREIIQSCDPPLGDLGANLDAYAGQRTWLATGHWVAHRSRRTVKLPL